MVKSTLPKRRYMDGEKQVLSIRISKDLIEVLKALAKDKGWNLTDLILTVLDQFAQEEYK